MPLFTLVRTFGKVLLSIVGGERAVEFLRTYFPGAVTEYVAPLLHILQPKVAHLSDLKVEVPVVFDIESTIEVTRWGRGPLAKALFGSETKTIMTQYEEIWLVNDLEAIDQESVFSESIGIKTFVTVAIVLGALAWAGVLFGAMTDFVKMFVGRTSPQRPCGKT